MKPRPIVRRSSPSKEDSGTLIPRIVITVLVVLCTGFGGCTLNWLAAGISQVRVGEGDAHDAVVARVEETLSPSGRARVIYYVDYAGAIGKPTVVTAEKRATRIAGDHMRVVRVYDGWVTLRTVEVDRISSVHSDSVAAFAMTGFALVFTVMFGAALLYVRRMLRP